MNLHYRHYGSGPRVLIILHGLLGASGNWHSMASRMFAPHFQVFAIDQRNHGRSPHTEEFSYEAMAGDLAGFMEFHRIQKAAILGHSMGGKTAMKFALEWPERTEKLIVADIAPRQYEPRHVELIEAMLNLKPERFSNRADIDRELAHRVHFPAIRQFLLKNLHLDEAIGRYRWQLNLETLYRNYDAVNEAIESDTTYDGPALFLKGERSDYIRDVDRPAIRHLFPKAEFVSIPEAGHWLHADQPQAFANAVLAFVS